MKAHVDPELCIGCGLCAEVCPEVFEMGSDDVAKVKVAPVPAEAEDSCRDAAAQCPSSAIQIEEG